MTENLHGLVAAYAAYAVDAVDVEERAAFEAHLPGCEDCTLELAELREVAAQIGAAETGPVPPGLRASVLAEVSRTAQVPPHATTPGPATPTPASGHRDPSRTPWHQVLPRLLSRESQQQPQLWQVLAPDQRIDRGVEPHQELRGPSGQQVVFGNQVAVTILLKNGSQLR